METRSHRAEGRPAWEPGPGCERAQAVMPDLAALTWGWLAQAVKVGADRRRPWKVFPEVLAHLEEGTMAGQTVSSSHGHVPTRRGSLAVVAASPQGLSSQVCGAIVSHADGMFWLCSLALQGPPKPEVISSNPNMQAPAISRPLPGDMAQRRWRSKASVTLPWEG